MYAAEKDLPDEVTDPGDPAFWQYIKKNFEDVLEMLNQMIDDMEVDPEEVGPLPEYTPNPNIEVLEKLMRDKTMQYAEAVDDFFRESAPYFARLDNELGEQVEDGQPVNLESWQFFQDAVEVIRWYQYFIGAKIHRAINGLEHIHAEDDPVQSDANGSAKIALIAVERSLGAWEVLRQQLPEKKEVVLHLQQQLQHLHTEISQLFPDWARFHRPGFDDEPDKNIRLDFNPN